MNQPARPSILERATAAVGRLRFPWVFLITAVIFVVDLVVPDMIPFIDEVLLGLATVLLASWKKQKTDAQAEPDAPRLESSAEPTAADAANPEVNT